MKLYLDLCALKRPFDDRTQARVEAEARAVFAILDLVQDGQHELIWSAALTFENDADPDAEACQAVRRIAELAVMEASANPAARSRALALEALGLGAFDAVHLALAEAVGCDVLVTCDDRFFRRAGRTGSAVRVLNPIECLKELQRG